MRSVSRSRGQCMVFNEEKILYFASQESAFHLQPGERKDTDASRIVRQLLDQGYLECSSDDKSGKFYKTTAAGERRLLELQIKWRRNHGKDTSEHEKRLKQLEGEC